jgi:HEAT repeat protein
MPRSALVLGALLLVALPAPASSSDDCLRVIDDPSSPIADAKKAVVQLGEAREPRAVSSLVKLLYEDHQGRTLAPEASFALFQIGQPSADALLKIVQQQDSQVRTWATEHHVPDSWLLAEAAPVLGDLVDARAEAPLVGLLRYENENKKLELVVRRRAAAALGRLHSTAAVDRLAELVTVENFQARHEFVHALVQIGGRRALPALARAAGDGAWEARQVGLHGLTMLGDEREQPAFEQMLQREADIITTDCRAHPNYAGCDDQTAQVTRMLSPVRGLGKRLEAAARCKQDLGCWTERLKDADADVRERAVLEVARAGTGRQVEPLFAAVDDRDAAVQLAAVQALEWLLAKDASARELGQRHVPSLEARLVGGEDTVAGARFAAPLRRILHRLRRGARSD